MTVFLSHIDQIFIVRTRSVMYFVSHVTTLGTPFRDNLSIHQALENAIYLWGAFFSYNSTYTAFATAFLRRILKAIMLGMTDSNPSRLLDVAQATSLVAFYFLTNGRLNESVYHLSGAVSLVTSFRLHQISPNSSPNTVIGAPTS